MNLGKKKIFVKQMGVTTFDGVLIMKGQEVVAGTPVMPVRPNPGDTLTIVFMSEEEAERGGKK